MGKERIAKVGQGDKGTRGQGDLLIPPSPLPYAPCSMPILAYHKVDSQRELGITSLSPQRFERQIRFLEYEGYTIISPPGIFDLGLAICDSRKPEQAFGKSLSKRGNTGASAPVIEDPKSETLKPVLITFDDGYEGVYTYAYPILEKYAFTAIIFVTTGYIGRYNNWDTSPGPRFKHLDWDHIRGMARGGIWFGSHGVNHTFLTKQSDSAARYEIGASKNMLEDKLGQPVHFFSYPYGDYDDRITNFVREAGYKAAFSLRPELLKAGCAVGARGSAPILKSSVYESIDQNLRHGDTATWGHGDAEIAPSSYPPVPPSLLYALPRIAIYLVDNMRAFKAKIGYINGDSPSYIQRTKNRLINRCSYASMLVERLRS